MNEERRAQLEAQIDKLETVSTAPVILQPLLESLRQPSDDIRTEKVVELASRGGAIAAQCLRMANSPLFAHRPVETIRAAIMTLGIEKVRSLLFGLCMNRTIPKDKWGARRQLVLAAFTRLRTGEPNARPAHFLSRT